MLVVVTGQVIEVLGQTCMQASFPSSLWQGVSIDDRLVCVFSAKYAPWVPGVRRSTYIHVFEFFKGDLRWQGLKSGQKRLLWCGYAL